MRTTANRLTRAIIVSRLPWLGLLLPVIAHADELRTFREAEARATSASVTTLVQGIGDAENTTFTADGRLFVTGGENAYEIVRDADGYRAEPLYAGTCNFTGIAARDSYLYATCAEGADLLRSTPHLLVGALDTHVALEVVHQFRKLGIPNGIAFDARGRLFVSDFTPLAGKIVTLTLDPSNPRRVAREAVWHDMGHPLANGLKIAGSHVYLTDLGELKVIPIRSDGSAGPVHSLAMRLSVLDDLWVGDDRIIVADFYGGRLLHYSLTGKLLKQTPPLFRSPSSVRPGRPPLVPEGSLVVTEKGALGELTSSDGNRLTLYLP